MCIFSAKKIKGWKIEKIETRFSGAENEKENEIRLASSSRTIWLVLKAKTKTSDQKQLQV